MVDVEGQVSDSGQTQPGPGQRVQATTEIEHRAWLARDLKDGLVKPVEDGQPLAGGTVEPENLAAGCLDLLACAGLVRGCQVPIGLFIVDVSLEGPVDLVESPLGGLGGGLDIAMYGQLAPGNTANGAGADRAILFRRGYCRDGFVQA